MLPLRFRWLAVLAAIVATAACSGNDPSGADSGTGLDGVVLRGPVQPVCRDTDPCEDEPFSARFTVRRPSGLPAAAFESNDAGEFSVALSPGDYVVVPAADAPIMSPASQTRQVVVGESGRTTVELHFDTGIR